MQQVQPLVAVDVADTDAGHALDRVRDLARLGKLADEHDILRIKGFAAVAGRAMRLVIQGVGGRFQHYYDRDWAADEARVSRLVVIGQRGLDRQAIEAAIQG